MSKLGIWERLLSNLEGRIHPDAMPFLSKERALEFLRNKTGQDFGTDSDKWREYIRANREALGVGNFETI
jgi:hypothetical protein